MRSEEYPTKSTLVSFCERTYANEFQPISKQREVLSHVLEPVMDCLDAFKAHGLVAEYKAELIPGKAGYLVTIQPSHKQAIEPIESLVFEAELILTQARNPVPSGWKIFNIQGEMDGIETTKGYAALLEKIATEIARNQIEAS